MSRTETAPKKNAKSKDAAKAKKPKKDGAKKKNAKSMAKQADKHDLYQRSVQSPDDDVKFYRRFYKKLVGKPAVTFREDFCGTAILSCEWVKLDKTHHAVGVDLDGPTLDWGRKHNVSDLKRGQQERLTLIQDDVRSVQAPLADILVAANFSYSLFKQRAELRDYFQNCYDSIAEDGLLIIDAWGGSDTQVEQVEEREVEDDKGEFTYCWDQHLFDPVSYNSVCKIHFEFEDGSRMNNAFTYDWRMWPLPDLRELFEEVGFKDVHVLWEGTERATGEGNGVFRRVQKGEADDAWIAYVVGRR